MTESMTDDTCLDSITHGCCEGGRRPSWQERKSMTDLDRQFYHDIPSQCCVMPVDVSQETVDAIKAVAEGMDSLLDQRARDYGPPEINMTGIGLIWTAQLRNHYGMADLPVLSGQMVALMMAGLKLNRLAKSPGHQDSYDDADGYLEIARHRVPPAQTKG